MVAVETQGFSGDYVNNYVVFASTEADAKMLAMDESRDDFPYRDVLSAEAYRLRPDRPQVFGRLVNPEEELSEDD